MGQKLDTFSRNGQQDFCEVHVNPKEEIFYIKYFKDQKLSETVEYPGESYASVKQKASEWSNEGPGQNPAVLFG